MAKRKPVDDAASEGIAPWDGADFAEFLEPFAPSAEELGPLADDVLSFLDKRSDLARKLSHEIEATEKKLAELRRTAAALFPEATGELDVERERPERKLKKTPARSVKLSQVDASEPAEPTDEPVQSPAVAQDQPAAASAGDGSVAQVA